MARPLKEGIDYFPHDTNMSEDLKIQMLETKYEITGYAVYNKILEQVYKYGGKFNLKEETVLNFMAVKWLGKNPDSVNRLREMVEYMISINLFKSWNFSSNGIKIRITKISDEREKKRNKYKPKEKQEIKDGFRQGKTENNPEQSGETPQIKGKEIKGKEIKGKEIKEDTIAQNKKNLQEVVKQVSAGMGKTDNVFEYILVGRNGYQTRREIPLKQLIKSKYKTPFDFRKHVENLKARPREDFTFDNKDDESILEYLADMILTSNELESTGINSNLKPELVKEMKLILESKQKIK